MEDFISFFNDLARFITGLGGVILALGSLVAGITALIKGLEYLRKYLVTIGKSVGITPPITIRQQLGELFRIPAFAIGIVLMFFPIAIFLWQRFSQPPCSPIGLLCDIFPQASKGEIFSFA